MTEPAPPTPTEKLPVLRTAVEAYRIVFSNFRLFLIAAAVPLALSALIAIPRFNGWISTNWLGIEWWGKLHYLPHTILGVAWCRFVLLGREVAAPTFFPRWHPRLGHFFIFLFPTLLIFNLVNRHVPVALYEAYSIYVLNVPMDDKFFLTTEYNIISPLIQIGAIYFLLRFSFLFSAMAIDRDGRFRMSWTNTRGCSFRLLVVFILCFILFHLVEFIAYDAMNLLTIGQSSIISLIHGSLYGSIWSMRGPLDGIEIWGLHAATLGQGLVFFISDYLWIGLVASMISIAFRTCTGWVPAVSTPPAQGGASD